MKRSVKRPIAFLLTAILLFANTMMVNAANADSFLTSTASYSYSGSLNIQQTSPIEYTARASMTSAAFISNEDSDSISFWGRVYSAPGNVTGYLSAYAYARPETTSISDSCTRTVMYSAEVSFYSGTSAVGTPLRTLMVDNF